MKNIFIVFMLILTTFNYLSGQEEDQYPDYYSSERTTRKIKTNTALLLPINGEYAIWYKTTAKFTQEENRITRPFIICEGFDVANNQDFSLLYEQLNHNSFIRFNNDGDVTNFLRDGLLDDLRCAGYDVIILNLGSNTKPIEENAELFIKLIKEIDDEVKSNAQNNGTFYHRSVVGGISMGGLISRLALTDPRIYLKEFSNQESIPVEAYLSFDSPHGGANIPLGLQQLTGFMPGVSGISNVTQVNALLPAELKQLRPFYQLEQRITSRFSLPYMISPAGQQMAITYGIPVSKFTPQIVSNPARAQFENRLNNNGMPICRKIGVSCGASRVDQQGIGRREPLIEIYNGGFCLIDRDFRLPFRLGKLKVRYCPLTFGLGAWAMPGKDEVFLDKTAEMGIGAQAGINGYTLLNTYPLRSRAIYRDYSSNPPDVNVDHVPGAYLPSFNEGLRDVCHWVNEEIDIPVRIQFRIPLNLPYPCPTLFNPLRICTLDGFDIDQKIGTWRRPLGSCRNADNFAFVPTASALAIKNKNWHTDFNSIGVYPQNDGDTDFDAIYWDTERNNQHAYVANDAMASFIEEEIAPRNLFIQNRNLKNGFRNTFVSDGYIVLGKNVDPTPNRQPQGDVKIENAGQIVLMIPDDQFVYFDDGFDASNFTSGEIEVVTYPNARACRGRGANVVNQAANSTWRSLRSSKDEGKSNSPENTDNFSGLIPSNEPWTITYEGEKYTEEEFMNKFNIKEDDLGFVSNDIIQDEENTIIAFPNPIEFNTTFKIHLEETQVITIELLTEKGELMLSPITSMTLAAGDMELDFQDLNLPNGVYIVNARNEEKIIASNKIVIMKK